MLAYLRGKPVSHPKWILDLDIGLGFLRMLHAFAISIIEGPRGGLSWASCNKRACACSSQNSLYVNREAAT